MTAHDLRFDGPVRARNVVVLAHGAGAPMDSDFMNDVAEKLAQKKIRVVRFEFPYMVERRRSGRKRPPNTAEILLRTWREVLAQFGTTRRLVIGGKSMGGRIASMVADAGGVRGLVCLGYPFHPPGRPENPRTAHLVEMQTPALIVQGERDPFGTRSEVDGLHLSEAIEVAWMPDGDHSFKPRVKSGHTLEQNLSACAEAIAQFVAAL